MKTKSMKINTYDVEALKKLTKDELVYLVEKLRDMRVFELNELEIDRRNKTGEMIDHIGYGGACDLRFKVGDECKVVSDTGSGGVLAAPIGDTVKIDRVIEDDFSHFYMVTRVGSSNTFAFHDDELELINS